MEISKINDCEMKDFNAQENFIFTKDHSIKLKIFFLGQIIIRVKDDILCY